MQTQDHRPSAKRPAPAPEIELDFDFKPITSGLGFHHQRSTPEVRPVVSERPRPIERRDLTGPAQPSVYQNDLSIFYGPGQSEELPLPKSKGPEATPTLKMVPKGIRVVAYLIDLGIIGAAVSLVLTTMTRTSGMRLMEVWRQFPHEITPLVLTLAIGSFVLYFSVLEKTVASTPGKNLFKLRVVTADGRVPGLNALLGRTLISLANFISLGLFSWFDLQSKASGLRVVRSR
jgi:uncharacterized RDD family membrane protein YckC